MLAAFGSDVYKIVLVLHILCAIVGIRRGVAQRDLRAAGEGAHGEARASRSVRGEPPRLGGRRSTSSTRCSCSASLLVLIGDNVFDFGQTWIWLSMVLFIAALGRVARDVAADGAADAGADGGDDRGPARRQAGPPPQAAEMEALGKRLGIIGPALDLTMIVILVLMVFKPGGPAALGAARTMRRWTSTARCSSSSWLRSAPRCSLRTPTP